MAEETMSAEAQAAAIGAASAAESAAQAAGASPGAVAAATQAAAEAAAGGASAEAAAAAGAEEATSVEAGESPAEPAFTPEEWEAKAEVAEALVAKAVPTVPPILVEPPPPIEVEAPPPPDIPVHTKEEIEATRLAVEEKGGKLSSPADVGIGGAERAELIAKGASLSVGEKAAGYTVEMAKSYMSALSKVGVTPSEISALARGNTRQAEIRAGLAPTTPEFVPPVGGEVVERHATGKPNVYEKDGVRFYTPLSTMWRYNFETDKEYREASQSFGAEGMPWGPHAHEGSHAPSGGIIAGGRLITEEELRVPGALRMAPDLLAHYIKTKQYKVPVQTHRGDFILLTPKQSEALTEAEGKRQFDLAAKYNIIPRDAKFFPREGLGWTFIKAEDWEKQKEAIEKRKEELKEFGLELKEQFPELYKIYEKEGIEGYYRATEGQELARGTLNKKLEKMGCLIPPSPGETSPQYDLVKAFSKGVTPSELNLIFPLEVIEKYFKIFAAEANARAREILPEGVQKAHALKAWTTQTREQFDTQKQLLYLLEFAKPTIGTMSVSDEEYAKLIRPPGISDTEYKKFIPFIAPLMINVAGAINAGVSDDTIKTFTGATELELEEYKWMAEYEKANPVRKMGMVIARDPGEAAKNLGIAMVPVYGTEYFWEDSSVGWRAAFIIGDIVFILPVVGQISAAVKGGTSLTRAVVRGTVTSARGLVIAPYTLARHPKASAMALISPMQVLTMKARQPLATFWRGSYSPTMDISKVLAGEGREALATRKAMEEMSKLLTSGEKAAGELPITDISSLKFSGTGMQKTLPNTVISSTAWGDVFKGKGVVAEGEGIWAASEAYLGLAHQSATGRQPLYIFKGKELIGLLDETGKAMNQQGKLIGGIAKGSKVVGLDGKALGIVDEMGKVWKDKKLIGQIKNGAIVTDDLKLIGKYYDGIKEIKNHKVIGTINKEGMIVNEVGKVIGSSPPKAVGYIQEGTKVIGEAGKVIGEVKGAPTFAIIQTRGIQELPEWAQKAGSIEEMEKRAWELFKSGKYGDEVYPVFKQYAKWIENENLLPKGTKLIPVVDSKGRTVMMTTRGLRGEIIEVPMLQMVKQDWFQDSLNVTRQLAEKPLDIKPMKLSQALAQVKNLPKKSVEPILAWLKKNKEASLIGSTPESIWTKGKIKAVDLDIAHPDPFKVVDEVAEIIRKSSGKQVRVVKTSKNALIEVLDDGLWRKAVDLDPLGWLERPIGHNLKPFETVVVEGINVQTPQNQLSRLFARMADDFSGKGYARFSRFTRAMGQEVDLGIGAKPPTLKQLLSLKVRGIYNTVRDIFVKGLTKETRLKMVEELAPDLSAEARAMLRIEARLEEATRAYQRAALNAVDRVTAATVKNLTSLRREVKRLEIEYRQSRLELRNRLLTRADILQPMITRLPSRYSVKTEERYRALLEVTPYTRGVVRIVGEGARLRIPRVTRVPRRVGIGRRADIPRVKIVRGRVRIEERRMPPPRVPSRVPPPRVPPRVPPRIPLRVPPKIPPRVPPKVPPPPRPPEIKKVKKLVKAPKGSIAWRQGMLKQEGKLQPVWYVVEPPYVTYRVTVGELPIGVKEVKGGARSAMRSIQTLTGKPPKELLIDLGIMDIEITRPVGVGKVGAIKYKRDIKQKTYGKITIGKPKQLTMGR